jgi:DsbC/DsbD-like thiol-disulfide interchange protein
LIPVLFPHVIFTSHVSTPLTTTTTVFLYICEVIIILETQNEVLKNNISKSGGFRKKDWPFSQARGIVLPSAEQI